MGSRGIGRFRLESGEGKTESQIAIVICWWERGVHILYGSVGSLRTESEGDRVLAAAPRSPA